MASLETAPMTYNCGSQVEAALDPANRDDCLARLHNIQSAGSCAFFSAQHSVGSADCACVASEGVSRRFRSTEVKAAPGGALAVAVDTLRNRIFSVERDLLRTQSEAHAFTAPLASLVAQAGGRNAMVRAKRRRARASGAAPERPVHRQRLLPRVLQCATGQTALHA